MALLQKYNHNLHKLFLLLFLDQFWAVQSLIGVKFCSYFFVAVYKNYIKTLLEILTHTHV